jgi:hypothetical protein
VRAGHGERFEDAPEADGIRVARRTASLREARFDPCNVGGVETAKRDIRAGFADELRELVRPPLAAATVTDEAGADIADCPFRGRLLAAFCFVSWRFAPISVGNALRLRLPSGVFQSA